MRIDHCLLGGRLGTLLVTSRELGGGVRDLGSLGSFVARSLLSSKRCRGLDLGVVTRVESRSVSEARNFPLRCAEVLARGAEYPRRSSRSRSELWPTSWGLDSTKLESTKVTR